jgi:hypothetical protein
MNPLQQAILARDMIDMIREHVDDSDVLEYLESFAFSIARVLENVSTVDWDEIAGVCDQRYYSLKQNSPISMNTSLLDPIYRKCVNIIESQNKQ